MTAAKNLYGIDPADYGIGIGIGSDSAPRIIHKDKQYNLGNFFTKHLHDLLQGCEFFGGGHPDHRLFRCIYKATELLQLVAS